MMEFEDPKTVMEKAAKAETLRNAKWYRSKWFRLTRTPIAAVLLLGAITYCTVQPTFHANSEAKLAADPDQLKQEVREFTTDIETRYYQDKENMAKCRAYIRKKFAAAGAVVEEQEYTLTNSAFPQYNVRGFYGDKSKPRIVIGAHYDTCMPYESGVNPGADDNASGVVGLFGLARLLQKKAPKDVCVELVAYGTEEPPYFGSDNMGSYRHAQLLREENVQVKGVLVLEMIGFFTDEPKSQQYPSLLFKAIYPSEGNFISVVGGYGDRDLITTTKEAMKGAAPLKVVSSCIPRNIRNVHLSDHHCYWKFDYNAVMISDTSFYRTPHYHKPTDTWDTLDYGSMACVVTQVHQAVLAIAEMK